MQVSVEPRSLFSGAPRIAEIAIEHPLLRTALLRERVRPSASTTGSSHGGAAGPAVPFAVDRISATNGEIAFVTEQGSEQSHIDQLDLTAVFPGREDSIEVRARWDGQPVHLAVKGSRLVEGLGGKNVPIEFRFHLSGLQTISGAATIKPSGTVVEINSLAGSIGPARFNGRASVDVASKPLITVDVSVGQLAIPLAPLSTSPERSTERTASPAQGTAQPKSWNDQIVKLDGLNYFDADLQFSASELSINAFRVAPISVHAALQSGVMQATVSAAELCSGRAEGSFSLDVAGQTPTSTMHFNLSDVRAQPLLSDLTDFRALDGRMRAAIELHASGVSERAAIATLNGTVQFAVQDGQVRGINIPKMIRGLSTRTLFGWQDIQTESTDFGELWAQLRVVDGRATTEDLRLTSPLVRMTGTGSVDLVNRTLAFKLDPRLVMSSGRPGRHDRSSGPWRSGDRRGRVERTAHLPRYRRNSGKS